MVTPAQAARYWREHIAPKHRLNRHPQLSGTQCQCICGEVFPSYYALIDHTTEENSTTEPSVDKGETFPYLDPDLVAKALGAEPMELIENPWLEVEHTWLWEDHLEGEVYKCKCSTSFETHQALMDHTAEKNPVIETHELGRAGVAIERSAHEKTLKKLKRAVEIFQELRDHITGKMWSHGPQCQRVEGTPYIDCVCNLKQLGEIYSKDIEPFLVNNPIKDFT